MRPPIGYRRNLHANGPDLWRIMHLVTFLDYGEDGRNAEWYKHFFKEVVPRLLACRRCAHHYLDTIATKHPLTDKVLSSQETLARWLHAVHNVANTRLRKSHVTFDAVKRFHLEDMHVPLTQINAGYKLVQLLRLVSAALRSLKGVA